MAESLLTKKALADSLKEQLKIEPLDKISIAEICDRCNLNRKSFYYHFEDKPNLINWIFDTEYLSEASKKSYATQWESVENLCRYLYLNKNFYKKVLKSQDAEHFTNHIRLIIEPIIKTALENQSNKEDLSRFKLSFYTDAVFLSIHNWLTHNTDMNWVDFSQELKLCLTR